MSIGASTRCNAAALDNPVLDQLRRPTIIFVVEHTVIQILAIARLQPKTVPQHALRCARFRIAVLEPQPFRNGLESVTLHWQHERALEHMVKIDASIQQLILRQDLIGPRATCLPEETRCREQRMRVLGRLPEMHTDHAVVVFPSAVRRRSCSPVCESWSRRRCPR
jgi:hypothetical protein